MNTIKQLDQPYLYNVTANAEEIVKKSKEQQVKLMANDEEHLFSFYGKVPLYLTELENNINQSASNNKLYINNTKKIIGISLLVFGALALIFTAAAASIALLPFTATLAIGAGSAAIIAVGIYLSVIGFRNPVHTFLDQCDIYQGLKEIINGDYEKAVEQLKTYTDESGMIDVNIVNNKFFYGLDNEGQPFEEKHMSFFVDMYFSAVCLDLREMRMKLMAEAEDGKYDNLVYPERFKSQLEIAKKINLCSHAYINYLFVGLESDLKSNSKLNHELVQHTLVFSLKKTPEAFVITPKQ